LQQSLAAELESTQAAMRVPKILIASFPEILITCRR
jgi:hypothetical protein